MSEVEGGGGGGGGGLGRWVTFGVEFQNISTTNMYVEKSTYESYLGNT